MLPWRRAFSTSLGRLEHAAVTRPQFLRCADVDRKSKQTPCALEGQEIKLRGLLRSVRKQKEIAFAAINDGTSFTPLQVILSPEQAAGLTTGAAVEVSGIWKASKPGLKQTHELHASTVTVVGESDKTYPIQKKYHTPEFLRQHPHLRFRTPFNTVFARFRSACIANFPKAFRDSPFGNFLQVHPPIITSSDCEGAGETFAVVPRETLVTGLPEREQDHFFRAPKYLSVSSQLHLEAFSAALGNVWAMAPAFRAERSDTPRHLSEFYMVEVESNFISNLEDLTNMTEDILRRYVRQMYKLTSTGEFLKMQENAKKEHPETQTSGDLHQRWGHFLKGRKWRRMTYTDAIARLQKAVSEGKAKFEHVPTWSTGLQLEHERYIVDVINKGRPIFVTDYPKTIKPFYMAPSHSRDPTKPAEKNPGKETVACFDLLLPELGEVAGGSLREHRLPELIQNMREHGLIKKTAIAVEETEGPEVTEPEAKESEVQESDIKDTEVEESEVKESEVRESEAQKTEVQESEVKEAEVKQTEVEETQVKETETQETEAKESQATELTRKEKKAKRKAEKEQKAKEREARDKEAKEIAAKEQLYPHLLPGEDLGHLQWYADLRRWGSAPHGGFGIGFDRLISYLTGVQNVRDVVPFPRYAGKADC
ncbi:Putative Asparaginyl-tRNA synthetase [Aspergillus calidoustus]|uniref:Putative Asparaginyl-tRNA synthetase n=1 Tax=Aspergillus calidoustus TaxID=454130 RepID=A0A0U5G984_ASPCI|nr:Putative Asparaginyl-tRNA synthetase [Aspergillus calidoustus]